MTTKKAKKRPATKKTTAPKQAAAAKTKTIAVDGSAIDAILDLAGAPKPTKDAAAALERDLGKPLPAELRRYLERDPDLWNANADHPHVSDTSWAGTLPDVAKWLDQLADPHTGRLLAIQQFFGVVAIGCQINRCDFMYALAGVEPWHARLASGGVFYYDEREMGRWGDGTISAFLIKELDELWRAVDGETDGMDDDERAAHRVDVSDLRDVFQLAGFDHARQPPKPQPLPAAVAKPWLERARFITHRYYGICALLDALRLDGVVADQLPTAEQWEVEKKLVAGLHGPAMYWLFAHWVCGNTDELADCARLTAKHASPLVAALRMYVTDPESASRAAPIRDHVLDAVRRAAR